MRPSPLALSIRTLLAASLAAAAPAGATADPATPQDGSMVPVAVDGEAAGAPMIGPAMTVITREDIERSGDFSVAELLRDSVLAPQGSFRPQSGSSAQSGAVIDLRGLGAGGTLVLVDGRRAPGYALYPTLGADLNAIPLAMVERIEIFPEGNSARFGTDAVAGVVNIVTRRLQGAELHYGVGDPSIDGGDLEELSAVFGIDTGRTQLTGGAGKNRRGIAFTRDQISGDEVGYSPYGNSHYDWFTNRWLVVPGFDCDSGGFYLIGDECSYDFNRVAAHEASVDNVSVFVQGRHEITDDWDVRFAASTASVGSFGRYAPTPGVLVVQDGTPNDINGGVRCGDDGCASDGLPTYFYHRFAAAGMRDNVIDSQVSDYAVGFLGRLSDDFDVEFGVRRSDYHSAELGRGYVVRSLAQDAANRGDYDLSDPFGADAAVIDGFTATISRDARYVRDEAFATGHLRWQLPTGASQLDFGVEAADERHADRHDSLSLAGAILGTAGRPSQAARDTRSAWVEWRLPLAGNLQATLAGRHDRIDTGRTESLFSPKVSLAWQPLDWLGVRGSWGESFRAPSLDQLGLAPREEFVRVGQCPWLDCFGVDAVHGGNAGLDAEQATHWSVGFEVRPTGWLRVSADYWDVEVDKTITYLSPEMVFQIYAAGGELGEMPDGLGVIAEPGGSMTGIVAGWGNIGAVRVRGVDVRAGADLDFGRAGRLASRLDLTRALDHTWPSPWGQQVGNAGHPSLRAALRNVWSIADLGIGWNVHYIGAHGSGFDGPEVGAWTTHDLSLSWQAPWNATVVVGATNVGDRQPELVAFDERPWNFFLYDAYGRTTYLRYTQRF